MNFDKLKNQWEQESVPNQSIPQLELSMKRAGNAIDQVRRNMKKDFWGLITLFAITLTVLIVVPYLVYVHRILLFIAWSFFVTFSILSGYFLFRFYRFYKKSYTLSYSVKDSLWWFYYELRSFIDFYYTFTIVALTMGLSCGLSVGYIGANLKFIKGEENVVSKSMDQANELLGPLFLIFVVFILIASMIGVHYAVRYMYGKHLEQLKTTLDLLREEG